MSVKKDIMWRVGLVYVLMVLGGLSIIGKILWLQFAEHDLWSVNSDTAPLKEVSIEANRGNIYSDDGKLLAVSVPYYDIRLDLTVDSLTNDVFYSEVDRLSRALASLFGDRTWLQYKKALIAARQEGSQYYLVKRNITYDQMLKAREFPIFERGRYRGGVRFIEKSYRIRPNEHLAARTIGYTTSSESGNIVGLEGAYDDILRGKEGLKLYKRLSGNISVPLYDRNEIDPVDGMDIVSTIDLNIQDVAHAALLRQLEEHKALHGSAVLMEVETGDVKAIVNLQRNKDGKYYESLNFAVGESTVPGSTFKTASIMVALEDGKFSINDSVDIGKGVHYYSGTRVEDSSRKLEGTISIRKAFEVSSNVGITRIIHENYNKEREDFIKGLYELGLNQKLGLEIRGEASPFIKSPDHSDWSGISLPMMSMGYELTLTPLQMLSFYNGIANGGKVVKPRFVKEVRYRGDRVKRYGTEVLNSRLCSETTLEKIQELLIGVVEEGTARNLKNNLFRIAGKTGTAQIPDSLTGYSVKSRIRHQASFVGYFPADRPRYSCIVVVNSPSNDIYYGNLVAGPVFLEIAKKVYSTNLDMHTPVNRSGYLAGKEVPYSKSGYLPELKYALNQLGMTLHATDSTGLWVSTHQADSIIGVVDRPVPGGMVPNVVDMGLKDALYLLENAGLKVRFTGRGTVRSQSVLPGTSVKGQIVELQMSINDT